MGALEGEPIPMDTSTRGNLKRRGWIDRLFSPADRKPARRPPAETTGPIRLHVGCGPMTLNGWVNVDNQPYPGVDYVLDVTQGLPFSNAEFIFAEHFIEHLEFDAARTFLKNCRKILRDDGTLRVSTPNLDWVW